MKLFHEIKLHGGLLKTLKLFFYVKTGKRKRDEEIKTIYYILNNYTDITFFPKAKGNMKTLQENNLLMLKMFDKIAKKEGWTYWLDYGTLLGAIRHKGFIPWDDDMDIGMPREDYEKMLIKLPEYFNKMDLKMTFSINPGTNAVGIGIDHENTGIFCDIFYYDSCCCQNQDIVNGTLLRKIYKMHNYFLAHKKSSKKKIKKHFMKLFSIDGESNVFFISPETYCRKLYVFSIKDIFPLKNILFEDKLFPVPNNYLKFVKSYYGESYMEYPHSGVCHHGGTGSRPPLADWATINNVNINELRLKIISEIEKI